MARVTETESGSDRIDFIDSDRDRIERLLNSDERKKVEHAFSLHNMKSDGAGRMKLHLVLKFRYHESLIKEFFGAKKPKEKIQKRYGTAYRLFPYCIFNSIEETPISWTYQEDDQGEVYERIELFVTVTYVQYMRCYPFVLKLLNLKVGTDGTAKTGDINLLPKLKKDGKPDVDFGVFTKETSEYRISPDGIDTGDVICRMVVRDLTENTLGNLSGIYTRVYTVFVFEALWLENFSKYIVLPTIMMHLTVFLPKVKLASTVSTVLAVALTEVALLFVMPPTDELTTAERVIIVQVLYVISQAFVVGLVCDDETFGTSECAVQMWHMAIANMVTTVCTVAWCLREYRKYRRLVCLIKDKFKSVHDYVGIFEDIDKQI